MWTLTFLLFLALCGAAFIGVEWVLKKIAPKTTFVHAYCCYLCLMLPTALVFHFTTHSL